MRVTESINDRVRIVIARTAVPAGETRVRAELDHAVRDDRARERVTVSRRADERIDVAREILLGECRRAKYEDDYDRTYKMFQDLQDSNLVNHENLVNPLFMALSKLHRPVGPELPNL